MSDPRPDTEFKTTSESLKARGTVPHPAQARSYASHDSEYTVMNPGTSRRGTTLREGYGALGCLEGYQRVIVRG